jgi:hypothetical protein
MGGVFSSGEAVEAIAMSYPFSSKVLLVFSGIRPAASASGLTLPLEVCALTNNSLTLSNHWPILLWLRWLEIAQSEKKNIRSLQSFRTWIGMKKKWLLQTLREMEEKQSV